MNKKNYTNLFFEHNGKATDKWAAYLDKYEQLFEDYRERPLNILEIGIQNGGSLEVLSKYFDKGVKFLGLDINLECKKLIFDDSRIKVIVGDCNLPETYKCVLKEASSYDLIIDDGSHLSSDIVKSFCLYFPILVDGGFYVVEDLHCSYWAEFEGGLFDPFSSISFLKRLADIVNYEHWNCSKSRVDLLKGMIDKYNLKIDEQTLSEIQSVEFVNSMCIVRKSSKKSILGSRFIVGSEAKVVPDIFKKTEESPGLDQTLNPWTARKSPPDESIEELESRSLRLHIQNLGLIKKIDEIENSLIWRLTYPIRLIGKISSKFYDILKSLKAFLISLFPLSDKSKRIWVILRSEGFAGILNRVKRLIRSQQKKLEVDLNNLNSSINAAGPRLTIIIPTFNTPGKMLSEAIESVINQIYHNWQLIIVDDKSKNEKTRKTIESYITSDSRIKAIFKDSNEGISEAINSGLLIAEGEFVMVLDHDDTLDQLALYFIAEAVLKNPKLDYIYSDEDKLSENGKYLFGEFYKPDWSPEYFLSMMYTCHLSVYRTSLLKDIGGYRSKFDGAQDYDMTLRFINRTKNIHHIPKILYHWRVWDRSTAKSISAKPYATERAIEALREFLDSRNESYELYEGPKPGHHKVKFLPKDNPLVSIIIPTANGTININEVKEWHIDEVVKTISEKSKYKNFELIIVHNGDLLAKQLDKFMKFSNVRLVEYKSNSFSLSEKINLGSKYAQGEYLVIMNDDIRVISEDWLDQMLGMVQRDGVGVVGPKLLFPNQKIQHAGVVLLGGLPGHAFYEWPKDADGYAMALKVDRNCIAVTGACAITPKWLFEEVGGYSSRYPLNYNDIDYCLKLREKGYRSVCLANVEMYHFEGVSKEGGRSVTEIEINKFLEDWGEKYLYDPFYNPNLSQMAPYS